jgi:beta-glucanase (GH16 family)
MAQHTHGRSTSRRLTTASASALIAAFVVAVIVGSGSAVRLTGLDNANDNLHGHTRNDGPACTRPSGSRGGCRTRTGATPTAPATPGPSGMSAPPGTATGCNVLEQILAACGTATTTPAPSSTTTTTPTATPLSVTPAPRDDRSDDPETCAGATPPVPPPSGSWTCTLDDEFGDTSLDSTLWQPVLTSTSGFMSGSLLSQVCYVDNPDTVSETGGVLDLSVVQLVAPTTCQLPDGASFVTSYEGGMIASYQRFSQKYGYFAVRAAVPATSVSGLQETLWLYPENQTLYGPWPDSGEIDYGEFYSSYPLDDVPFVHYPGSSADPDATSSTGCTIDGDATAGQFNTYALAWTPTTITTYFNGVPCTSDTYAPYVLSPDTAPEPFNQPFFLAFTAALGMNGANSFQPGTTPLPATTQIDWVRVWQY